jgi:hypothetical protein
MTTNKRGNRDSIRYSEAFKMMVVREVEASGLALSDGGGQVWDPEFGDGAQLGEALWQWQPRKDDPRGKAKRNRPKATIEGPGTGLGASGGQPACGTGAGAAVHAAGV